MIYEKYELRKNYRLWTLQEKAVVVTLEAYHLTLNLPKKISKEAYSVLQYPKVYDALKARRQFYYSLLELSK